METDYLPWDHFWLWVAATVPDAWMDAAPLPVVERVDAAVQRAFRRLVRVLAESFERMAAAAGPTASAFQGLVDAMADLRQRNQDWFDANGYMIGEDEDVDGV